MCRQCYETVSWLGEGSNGTVVKVKKKDDASKSLCWKTSEIKESPQNDREEWLEEANKLRKLDHPNIVKYIDHFQETEDGKPSFFIVMELYGGGDLENEIYQCRRDCERCL